MGFCPETLGCPGRIDAIAPTIFAYRPWHDFQGDNGFERRRICCSPLCTDLVIWVVSQDKAKERSRRSKCTDLLFSPCLILTGRHCKAQENQDSSIESIDGLVV